MNMFNQSFENPFVKLPEPVEREQPRTKGYDGNPREESEPAVTVNQTPTVEVQEPESKKDIVDRYLETQFESIRHTLRHYLGQKDDSHSLEEALAEIEFYKQLVADAKVAWTKAVPHEEFAWDDLINLGTILSRTPNKE